MHNQADSLQITKKQDETERNKQKKKKTAHIWKQSGQPFPHSHSQIGSVGSNFSPVIDMLRQQPPFLRQLEYFHRSIKLKWWDWNEKKKNHQACFIWYRVSAASAKVDVINLKTSQHAEVLY